MKRFTLLADGPSDQALMPILDWMWRQHRPDELVTGQFADLDYTNLESRQVADRLRPAVDLYPCDVLFVHRDTERDPVDMRIDEIRAAVQQTISQDDKLAVVCDPRAHERGMDAIQRSCDQESCRQSERNSSAVPSDARPRRAAARS